MWNIEARLNWISTSKVLVAVLCCLLMESCSLLKKSEVEKAEIAAQRETVELNAELNKRQKTHYKIQARETKKMMKRSYKRSKKLNKPRRLL